MVMAGHPLAGWRIAIVGSGAMGCYYGGRLAQAGCDVHFLMRSDLEHVRAHGLVIKSHAGDFSLPKVQAHAVSEEIGPVDLVIVTLKSTANHTLAQSLPPLLHAGTLVLSIQNGLGNEESLEEWCAPEQILGGVAFTCINRVGPGVIDHSAQGDVTIGAYRGASAQSVARVAAVFCASGVRCLVEPSIAAVRWRKLVWNIPFNGLSILGGCVDTSVILADEHLRELARGLMEETVAVAEALGCEMPEGIVEKQFRVTAGIGPYRPSSMLDYEAGREVEVEAIWGRPWRSAVAAGVPAGRLAAVYHLICSMVEQRR